jgi:anaerobic selenocysteine-containing dehydrogenase
MHSQHFAFIDGRPEARAAKTTLERQGFADGDRARLRSVAGELEVIVRGDKRLPEGLVTIYQGWWHKNGSVNRLTTDRISDMGEQAAFYDCFVRLEPASDESS